MDGQIIKITEIIIIKVMKNKTRVVSRGFFSLRVFIYTFIIYIYIYIASHIGR